MSKSARKAPKKAGRKAGPLVPQPHGGAIYRGAPANPVAGTGRPRDEVRAAFLAALQNGGTALISDIIRGEVTYKLRGVCEHCGKEGSGTPPDELLKLIPSPDARIRAVEQAGKFSIGTIKALTEEHVREKLEDTYAILRRELDDGTWAVVDAALAEVWQ